MLAGLDRATDGRHVVGGCRRDRHCIEIIALEQLIEIRDLLDAVYRGASASS